MYAVLISSSVSCGTPSFASRVDVEPVTSTTVGPEIVYRCQSGLLQEGNITSMCGGGGGGPPTLLPYCVKARCMHATTRQTPSVDVHDLPFLVVLLTYWLKSLISCSKLWISKTSWNYCKLYQYSSTLPM